MSPIKTKVVRKGGQKGGQKKDKKTVYNIISYKRNPQYYKKGTRRDHWYFSKCRSETHQPSKS